MPNWVTSKLIVYGENSKEVLRKLVVKNEKNNEISFDFNKIKPRPKELEIVAGCITDICIEVFLSTLSNESANEKLNLYFSTLLFPTIREKKIKNQNHVDEMVKYCLEYGQARQYSLNNELVFENKDDIIAYGKQAMDNIEKYGSKDWYDWSVKNWGTKWNACDTVYTKNDNCVYFDTAWNDVRPIIKELSKQYPQNTFEYHYSEEQIGLYAGYAIFKDGEAIENVEHPEYSKEAYDESFELWGDGCKEDYKYDEKIKSYKHIDDEEDGGME